MDSILQKASEIARDHDKNIVLIVTRDGKTGKVDIFPFGSSQVEMMVGMAAGDVAKQVLETTKISGRSNHA